MGLYKIDESVRREGSRLGLQELLLEKTHRIARTKTFLPVAQSGSWGINNLLYQLLVWSSNCISCNPWNRKLPSVCFHWEDNTLHVITEFIMKLLPEFYPPELYHICCIYTRKKHFSLAAILPQCKIHISVKEHNL